MGGVRTSILGRPRPLPGDRRADRPTPSTAKSPFTPVSFDPPLALACIRLDSRFHRAVMRSGQWSVSILNENTAEHANWFASRRRDRLDQFQDVSFIRGELTGLPLLVDVTASLECVTKEVHPGGDHSILVGEVVAATLGGASYPLVRYQRRYRSLCRCGESTANGADD